VTAILAIAAGLLAAYGAISGLLDSLFGEGEIGAPGGSIRGRRP
jgi:hypothetical protein